MRCHTNTTIDLMSPETQRIMAESDRMHKQPPDSEGNGGGDGQSIEEIIALSEVHIVAYRPGRLDREGTTQHHDRMLGTPSTGKPNLDKETGRSVADKETGSRAGSPSVFLPMDTRLENTDRASESTNIELGASDAGWGLSDV